MAKSNRRLVLGRIEYPYEFHVTIKLSDGTLFQVPRDALKEERGKFKLAENADIEAAFPPRTKSPKQKVQIPKSVVARVRGILSAVPGGGANVL